ncbi:MAG: hypothetical protein JO276_08085 [Sphingomonadaceae bacterium]|nr:hypothetical protein [Sphingomonadaceae bacterium]
MRQDGISVAAQYRLARRSVAGEIAIDGGYMRQTMTRPGAPAMVQYVKFLVTLRRQPDGSWRITSDASMPSTEEAWNAAARVDGLRYDS